MRNIAWAVLVAGTWYLLGRLLGSHGEAFWLLFPLWVGAGVLLGVLPRPRSPVRRRWIRIAVPMVLVLFPAGFYLFLARVLGGRIAWKEVLVSIYFFAVSLEVLLIYVFQGFESLSHRLARGRDRRAQVLADIGTRIVLYSLLIPFLFATFSLHRVKIPSRPPDPRLQMAFEEVAFPSRGPRPVRLGGWFFPREKPLGTVLACHGVGANRADLMDFIYLLRIERFQVLVFDFRGHGESDGHTVTYGRYEREDVLGAWDYLLTRKDVDPRRIFGFGVSMGAASLLLALPELPEMCAAVADSAFSDLETMVRYQFRYLPGPAAVGLAFLTDCFGWIQIGTWVKEVSPIAAIEKVTMPIFFIHGLDDATIPAVCTERLHQAYHGPKKLRLVPDAGHGGAAGEAPARYGREVREFYMAAIGEGKK